MKGNGMKWILGGLLALASTIGTVVVVKAMDAKKAPPPPKPPPAAVVTGQPAGVSNNDGNAIAEDINAIDGGLDTIDSLLGHLD